MNSRISNSLAACLALAAACLVPASLRADVASAVSSATPLDFRTGLLTVKPADLPKSIADNALAASSLTVGNFIGTIADVNVSLDISHPYDSDLTAWLVGPQGTRVKLLGKAGGSGDNFTATLLDDEAGTAIASGTAPFTGSFRPAEPLNAFDGQDPNGTWTMEILDDTTNDTGTLDNWSLRFDINPAPAAVVVTTDSPLPAWPAAVTYSRALAALGGTPPYNWSVVSGSLPATLTLDPATGVISGTPTTSGLSVFRVQVTDAASQKATKYLSLTIRSDNAALVLGTASGGAISPAGETDSLTFHGQAGRLVTVVVNPGSAGAGVPQAPFLNRVRAELRDPGGTLLASADNAAAGQVLLLSNVAIPADGIYSLRLKAPAAAATATGNYTVTVWDATPDVAALAFNSQYSRRIENPYHVDRWTFYGTAGQQVRFKLLSPSTSGLGFDLTGPGAWSGFTNLTTTSGPITLPASGDYTLSAHSIGGAYGDSYTFSLEQILQSPVAVGTPFTGRFTGSGQLQVFAFDVTGAMPLLLDLANSGAGNLVEVYVRFGALPTFGSYDERVTGLATSGQSILIPRAAVGTYYVMIHAPYVPTASDFTFTATLPSFAIRSTQFGTGGNAGNFTIHAKGAGFDRTLTAVLGNTGGFTRPALANWFESETACYATFDLRGVAPGNYTVTFSKGQSAPVSVPNSLTVVAAGAPLPVIPRLTTPSATRRGREYSFTVEWENTTLNDALPPLLTVGNTVPFGLKSGDYSLGSRYTFLGINTQGGPAGILRAGQRETITFWAFSGTEAGTYTAFVDRNGKDPAAAFDWAALRPSLIPAGMTDAEFEPVFQRLISQVGTTWGGYLEMLSRNASLLPDSMGSARNIGLLRDMDVRRAMAATGASISGAILASTLDSDLIGQHLSATSSSDGNAFSAVVMRDGSFVFERVAPGTYTMALPNRIVTIEGMASVIAPPNTPVSGIIVSADPGSSLQGFVTIELTGLAVADAAVTLYLADGSVRTSTTNRLGEFRISGLPEEPIRISVVAGGYAKAFAQVAIVGKEATVDLSLKPESIASGSVLLDGAPPPDKPMVFAVQKSTANPNTFYLGDVAGNGFSIGRLPVGDYDLHVVTAQAAEAIPLSITSFGITSEMGFIQLTSGPTARWVNPPPYLIPALAAAEHFLVTQMLPKMAFWYGPQVAGVWADFIYSAPSFPRTASFKDGGSVVEGWLAQGFRKDAKMNQWFEEVLVSEANKLKSRFQNGSLTCRDFGSDGIMEIAVDNTKEVNFDLPLTIPGNIAGGHSGWDPDPFTHRDDWRRIRGKVIARITGPESLVVESQLQAQIGDCIDFEPGNVAEWSIEWTFTGPLNFLEDYGWAYGVPFTVDFADKPGRTKQVTIPHQECIEDPDDRDDEDDTTRPGSWDPNDITGPAGVGTQHHVAAAMVMPYTIRFENDAKTATAPAAMVTVKQNLDPDLDWTSFQLGNLGFGDTVVEVPANTAFYETRVDLTATRGVVVDVRAGINMAAGEAYWELVALDPMTGALPDDPMAGFLPPNATAPEGEGFVTYTIHPKRPGISGTRVDALATIVFDVNAPILTPAIFHTLDDGPPTVTLTLTPTGAGGTNVVVKWLGDDRGGVGIVSYDVEVSLNGGPYVAWLTDTLQTQATYPGYFGQQLQFRVSTADFLGQQATPVTATTVIIDDDYLHWRAAIFGTAVGDPAQRNALWSDDADPDSDGRSNLYEFLAATDPLVADAQFHPTMRTEGGTQIYRYRLTKVANHLVDHYIQWSPDGVRWFTGGLVFRIVEDHADYWLMEAVLALNGQPPVQFRQVAGRDVVYSHWIYEEGAAFSQRGQYQDPNGDRIPNAVAYALGLPAVGPVPAADLARLPKAVLERTPESRGGIVLGLPERMQPDVTLSIEASPNLTAGTWTEVARRTGTGAWQLLSARHPAVRTQRSGGVEVTTFTEDLAAQRFYRLRAEVRE